MWDTPMRIYYFDGTIQDCSNSMAKALELLQSCTNPSICWQIHPRFPLENGSLHMASYPMEFAGHIISRMQAMLSSVIIDTSITYT